MKRLMVVATIGLLVAASVILWRSQRGSMEPQTRDTFVGQSIDQITSRNGKEIGFADGQPSLLLVFSSTCPACAATKPSWQ
jgi:hypothetical protein